MLVQRSMVGCGPTERFLTRSAQHSNENSFELIGAVTKYACVIAPPLYLPLTWTQHPFCIFLSLGALITWLCFGAFDCNGWFYTEIIGYRCSGASLDETFW